MKKKFKAQLLSGHKDHAVEVPFDPSVEWKIAKTLVAWASRRFGARKDRADQVRECDSAATEKILSSD